MSGEGPTDGPMSDALSGCAASAAKRRRTRQGRGARALVEGAARARHAAGCVSVHCAQTAALALHAKSAKVTRQRAAFHSAPRT